MEVDSFIQSIEGPASMNAADWDKVFARLMTSVSKAADVELLKMEFAGVPREKLQLFGSWLVDTWFPQVMYVCTVCMYLLTYILIVIYRH